jgi:hypothetical protein
MVIWSHHKLQQSLLSNSSYYKNSFNSISSVIPNVYLLLLETKNKKDVHTGPISDTSLYTLSSKVLQHLVGIFTAQGVRIGSTTSFKYATNTSLSSVPHNNHKISNQNSIMHQTGKRAESVNGIWSLSWMKMIKTSMVNWKP